MSIFDGITGNKQTFSTSTSRASDRTAKMEARIQGLRKSDSTSSRDAAIRGPVQASSSRDYLAKSLGKNPAATRGTSIGRMSSGNSFSAIGGGFAPKLPPMRPMGR
ncbi:MAG: hypothetical protein WC787_04225 [Patescibacteria group bacterium]